LPDIRTECKTAAAGTSAGSEGAAEEPCGSPRAGRNSRDMNREHMAAGLLVGRRVVTRVLRDLIREEP